MSPFQPKLSGVIGRKKKSIPLYFSLKMKGALHRKCPNSAQLWVPLAHLVKLGPEQQHVI